MGKLANIRTVTSIPNAVQNVACMASARQRKIVRDTILLRAANKLHLLIKWIALNVPGDVVRLVSAFFRDSVRFVNNLVPLNNVNLILSAAQFAASKEFAWKRKLV